ncbi:unnamed protein product [Phaeothamnion confervicola]
MDRGLLKAQNVLFRNNSAEWDGGGAVFIRGRLLPEALEAAIVAGDAATLKEERRAVFLNCSFQSNLAHGNGGAVFLYQTVGFFSDSKLWQNSCLEGNGGAVFVVSDQTAAPLGYYLPDNFARRIDTSEVEGRFLLPSAYTIPEFPPRICKGSGDGA